MMQAPNDLIMSNNQQMINKSHQNLKQQQNYQQTLIINKNLDISQLTNMSSNVLITPSSYSNTNNENNNSSSLSSSPSSNNPSPNGPNKVVRDERRRANHNEGLFSYDFFLSK